ncbi:MAG: hypothetical protein HZB81_06675 [Deltaproteobacteria bacterium]|nr:hypothetical protein [Deltaproteobacteria bacterium]
MQCLCQDGIEKNLIKYKETGGNNLSEEFIAKLVIPAIIKPESRGFLRQRYWIPAKNTPE